MPETQAQRNKRKWLEDGNKIPICANPGCENNVVVRDWKYYSFKHICSNCKSREQKGLPPRDGVISVKKNYCENKDGRLGFVCPVDPNWKFPLNILHGDHVDGDHENNIMSNIQTLCAICHHMKGMASGDFNSAQKGRTLS